ncbi:MAG: hypothetical protein DYG98_06135 [Haliscomenobacteraceae bacterium CHB4]|nr:hypothetical protein [Saprospiraceae bacterium]MCE7922614.1 hypothetical protein [Haliscomenobacteraceae bacterium CHB4]
MRHTLFAFLAALSVLSLDAQDIPVDFIKNPDKPITIENQVKGKTLFFFYPEKLRSESFTKEGNPCMAYEMNNSTLKVERTSSPLIFHIPGDGEMDIRVLCRFSRDGDYFMALENSGQVQVLRIEGQGLTMQRTATLPASEEERIIAGVAYGTDAYILCSNKEKKTGQQLRVYRIDESGQLEKHIFPVGEKADKAVADMLKGSFKPLPTEYGMEQEPEAATNKTKMFAGEKKLWVTFDNSVAGSSGNTRRASVLKVVEFDLVAGSLDVKAFNYTDADKTDALHERRNSFIFDKKIFQLYMSSEQFMLRVRDLERGDPLFTKILFREDTIEGLANSPILVPGGAFGVEKEYRSVSRFVRRFSKFDPFIQVRRQGDDYLMCIGGHQEINNSSPVLINPSGTTPVPMAMGHFYSYDRSFAFYSAIHVETMTRSPVYFTKSLIAAYADMLSDIERPRDQALYRLGEHFYLGYFDKAEKKYRLRQLKVQTR